ncbi:LPXTG cell wall anchor domain-containing protein [Streptococcus uberis]
MEIKQKHGKHALRKAVTAAVLAGTAFSSLGGFAGAVTTVRADEKADSYMPKINSEDSKKLIEIGVEKKYGGDPAKALEKLRTALRESKTDTLYALLLGLDNAHENVTNGGIYKLYSDLIGTFINDKPEDWAHNHYGLNLASLLIQEINDRLIQNVKLGEEVLEKGEKLKGLADKIEKIIKERENLNKEITEKNSEISKMEEELIKKEKEIAENNEELTDTLGELHKAEETIDKKEAKVKDLTEKLDASRKEHEALAKEFAESQKGYEKELAGKHAALGEAEKRNADLEAGNKELKENLEMAEGISDDLQKKVMKAEQEMKELSAQLEEAKEELEAEKAKLVEAKEANDKLTEERDAAKKEAEKVPELEEQVEKLVEEITTAKKEAEELQAKAEGLEKDFEAVKAEKEALEAEIAKLKEDHQKEVDALNALLADKEKMLKNLQDQLDKAKEEAMKNEQMSQEEKAKLQAELDKAKQELADKIKDMPNKVAPKAEGKANAGQAAPNQNQNNQAQANQAKNGNNLPSTGDKPVNPLLVASGLSLMIGAGAFVYAGKRKKG